MHRFGEQLLVTHRGNQILELIAEGRTDKEIAVHLGISRKTVGTHVQRIFARYGVHSRAAAVNVWLKARRIDGQTGVSEASAPVAVIA